MKYLSKTINHVKDNALTYILIVCLINRYLNDYICFQGIIDITLATLVLIKAFYSAILMCKTGEKHLFFEIWFMFFVGFTFFFDGFKILVSIL
jgi:hypothetical protein